MVATPAHLDLGFSRFDLAVEMQMGDDHIGGYLEYNEALLDRSTAEELRTRLDQLLGAALQDPAAPLWKLPQPERATSRHSRRRSAVPASTAARPSVVARVPRIEATGLCDGAVVLHWLDLSRPVDPADEAALSEDERGRAEAFHYERHRRSFVRRRTHLRRILSEVLHVDPRTLTFATTSHRRPYLAGWRDRLRFSTSSSGDLGIVAVSRHELGVDVEAVAPSEADQDVARRLFATEEVDALAAAPGEDFVRLFFNCWTRKEAYVKATGLGLSFPLDSFSVAVHDDPAPRLLRSDLRPADLDLWAVRSLPVPTTAPGGGAAAALVVAHHDPHLTTHVDH